MRGIKYIITGICAISGFVGRQLQAQVLAPEEIPFTQDVGFIKSKGDQLCVLQLLADKGTYKTYTLAIKKGKNWIREYPVLALAPQEKAGTIEIRDIEFIGKRIYLAGNFKLNNSTKNCLVYFDRSSGSNPWKGDYEFSKTAGIPAVNSIAMAGDFMFIGGSFSNITQNQGPKEFLNIGKMTLNNFQIQRILLNKNNGADSTIHSIEFDSTNKILFIGGLFRKFAGQSIKGIAKTSPTDTSKVSEYTAAKAILSVYKMRLMNGKLFIFGLHDTSVTGPNLYISNGNLIKIKGAQSIFQITNFFHSGGNLFLQGYLKLAGQNTTLGLFTFSEIMPLTEAFRKFGTINGGESYNNEIYVSGNFKNILFEFTLGKIMADFQRFVGRVYADLDNNGVFSAGDKLIPKRNIRVVTSSGLNSILQTNFLGTFGFPYSNQPVLYKVLVENQGELFASKEYSFRGDTVKERVIDFPLKYKKNNYSDITIRMTAATGWVTRKDTSEFYVLTLANRGLIDVTVPKLNLNFDRVKDIKTFPAHNITNASSITWNDQKILAGDEKSFIIKLTVPSANYSTGQSISFNTSLSGIVDDNPGNNADSLVQTVTQGVPPFLKSQNPIAAEGDTFAWLLPSSGKIDYTIRFSNYGTDTTSTVVVKDTISTPDYVTYIQETGSSHAFTRQVYTSPTLPDKVIVTYTFANINLPPNPSGNSEVSSASGFIAFRVGFSPTLMPAGSAIRNRASIYMDYNAPVLTNMVVAKTAVSDVSNFAQDTKMLLYPNPCSEFINFVPETMGSILHIYAMDGRLIKSQQILEESLTLTNLQMASGNYLFRISTPANKVYSGILIKN